MFVTLENKRVECPEGIKLKDLAETYKNNYDAPVIVAKVNGAVQEFYHLVEPDSHIALCTVAEKEGKRAYFRGISMLLLKCIYEEIPEEKREQVLIEFCIDTGYYCRISGDVTVDRPLLDRIEARMRKYVEKDIRFEKKILRTREAGGFFERLNMPDKRLLTEYRKNSRMTVYELDGYTDYFYGAMPYSTGILKNFRLEKYEDGFVFVVPTAKEPEKVPAFSPFNKLFGTMQIANDWNTKMQVSTVGELNRAVVNGGIQELLLTQEALHEKRIGDIAEMIAKKGCRVVTIAGPSSSGKTTFSYRLSTQLKTLGLNPHPIGLDDYFVNREDTPKDANGKYNYECLEAIDLSLFNRHLISLLKGEEVQLPTYNFISGMREYNKPVLKLGKEDILVIEGIHGLNGKLTYAISDDQKFKIYISALTTLNLDNHNRIPTTEVRLLRRIIRDARTRGNQTRKTIAMWDSVRMGEQANIFPFQEQADAMFNSALIYELAAMKLYADPLLFGVTGDCDEYAEAQRLLKFLDYFLPIDPHDVPLNSILREFIGGGILLG